MYTDLIVQISTDKLSLYLSKFLLKFDSNTVEMLNCFFLINFVIIRPSVVISHEEVKNRIAVFKTVRICKHLFKKNECWSIWFLNLTKYICQLSITKIFWDNQRSCIILSKVLFNFWRPVHLFDFYKSVFYLSRSQVFSENLCTEKS